MLALDPTRNLAGCCTERNTLEDDETKADPKEPFRQDRVRGEHAAPQQIIRVAARSPAGAGARPCFWWLMGRRLASKSSV